MDAQEPVNLELLTDLCTPWCIRVVVTLRIAEHAAAGITDVDGLAAAAGCDADVLDRVLDHLVGKGIFQRTNEGRLALNQAARELLDPSMRLYLDLDGIGGRMAHAWGTMLNYVRTGVPAYSEAFGAPFWDDLDAHPDLAASFDEMIGPAGHGVPDWEFQVTGGWDSIRTVVDVGGGTGSMLAEILRNRPDVRGTLVDLPRTVASSGHVFQAAGVAGRVTTVGQSFFDSLPAGADLYLLRGVLNDWPDPEAKVILTRCAEAAGPSGRVVVVKGVGPEAAPRGLMIEMVLLGGRHRTVAEFSKLAGEAGLKVVGTSRQDSGHFVVECRPV